MPRNAVASWSAAVLCRFSAYRERLQPGTDTPLAFPAYGRARLAMRLITYGEYRCIPLKDGNHPLFPDAPLVLNELKDTIKEERLAEIKPKKAESVGVVEAPRGTLYYHLHTDDSGIVTDAEICIPTQQNVIHLEKDIAKYVEEMVAKNADKEKISMQIEKMIRAYDPCMSCATHFLKINWL